MRRQEVVFNVTATNDPRDWPYPTELLSNGSPDGVSRRDRMPQVLDQGGYGSCIGQTARTVLQDTDYADTELSAMCIYKVSQKYDDKPGENYRGSNFSAACQALLKEGVCAEHLWPYGRMDGLDGWSEDAAKRKIYSYYTVSFSDKRALQELLLHESLMIAFKASPYLFDIDDTGIVITQKYLQNLAGGHACALIGYRYINGALYWELQNSWGDQWADQGYCFMPDDLLNHIVMDKVYVLVTSMDHQQKLEEHKAKLKRMNFLQKLLYKIRKFLKELF